LSSACDRCTLPNILYSKDKMGANQSAEAPKEQVISAPDQSTSVQVCSPLNIS
jgi:hypothetical protein